MECEGKAVGESTGVDSSGPAEWRRRPCDEDGGAESLPISVYHTLDCTPLRCNVARLTQVRPLACETQYFGPSRGALPRRGRLELARRLLRHLGQAWDNKNGNLRGGRRASGSMAALKVDVDKEWEGGVMKATLVCIWVCLAHKDNAHLATSRGKHTAWRTSGTDALPIPDMMAADHRPVASDCEGLAPGLGAMRLRPGQSQRGV